MGRCVCVPLALGDDSSAQRANDLTRVPWRLCADRRPTDRARASCDNMALTQRAECAFVNCVAPDDSATEEWNNTCEYW